MGEGEVLEKGLEKEVIIQGTNAKWKVTLNPDGTLKKGFLDGVEMKFFPAEGFGVIDLSKMEEDAKMPPPMPLIKDQKSLKTCYPIRDSRGNIIGWHCV